jgi:hypothetical protein
MNSGGVTGRPFSRCARIDDSCTAATMILMKLSACDHGGLIPCVRLSLNAIQT